jgi:uncharacterized protein
MILPDILAPTYVQMLGALSAWLAKAEAGTQDGRAQTLPGARLAPDMFPLSTQIRFACVQAQEGNCSTKVAMPASIPDRSPTRRRE